MAKRTTPAPARPGTSPAPPPARDIVSTADLARHLDLSEWTVSRAINGHPEVKAATRQRVLEAMSSLGFQPNPHARGLNGKATGIVGICFGNPRNSLVIDKIASLEEFLRQHQLRSMLAINPHDDESELRILADFRHLRVDGIVLIQSYLASAELQRVLRGMKCVQVDPPDKTTLPFVTLDRLTAMRTLVTHLVALGHRSFGTLGLGRGNSWRWNGLETGLREHKMNPDRVLQEFVLEAPGEEAYGEGIALMKIALAAEHRPTAFLAVNDRVAAGAIQYVRDQGYSVPGDFSIAGFDNLEVGRHLRPTLTTIDQQTRLAMERAGELLLAELGLTSKPVESLLLQPLFIPRESTGPAPKTAPAKSKATPARFRKG